MNRHLRLAPLLVASAVLAACGGGGDDSGNSGFIPPTNDFNAFAGYSALLYPPQLRSWVVSGRGNDGNQYQFSLSVQALSDERFPLDGPAGTPWFVTRFGSTLVVNGNVEGTGAIDWFFDNQWAIRGVRAATTTGTTTSTTCDSILPNSVAVPPVAVKVNSSGQLYDADIRSSCTPGAGDIGDSLTNWSVEFEAGLVFLCLSTTDSGPNATTTTEKDCVEIDAAGNLGTRARVSLSDSTNFSVVARNY